MKDESFTDIKQFDKDLRAHNKAKKEELEVLRRAVMSWEIESKTNLDDFLAAADLIKHWPSLSGAEFGLYRDRFMKAYKINEIEKGEKFIARF